VIGHQAVGPDFGAGASRRRPDEASVQAVIGRLEKYRFAPVAALRDVMRQSRHDNPRDPRHLPLSSPHAVP
jgi:hypothetical protein